MTKKLTTVLALVIALSALVGCSSAKKNTENTPAPASVKVDAPVNLGASSGGRGI